MMYDTFHAHIEEKDPRAALQDCADVLVHVHVSENDRGTPGTGQVAWDETFAGAQGDRLRRLDRDRGVRRRAARPRGARRRSGGECSRARSSSRATAPRSSATAGAASRPSRPSEYGRVMRIALFVTCLGDTLYPETGRATVELLERLGHEVVFPAEQTCCGQLHANSGYRNEGLELVERFERDLRRLRRRRLAVVVVRRPRAGARSARDLSRHTAVFELSELLVHRLGVEDVGASFPYRVAYHPTCHSLRVTKVGDAPLRLLRNVRGLELVQLERAEECCGFGGTFAVKNAETSRGDSRRQVRCRSRRQRCRVLYCGRRVVPAPDRRRARPSPGRRSGAAPRGDPRVDARPT